MESYIDKEDKSESHTEEVMKGRGTGTEAGEDLLYEPEEISGEDEGQTGESVHREGEEGGVETKKLGEEWGRIRVEMEKEEVGGSGEETPQPYPYSPEYYYLKVGTQGSDDYSECVK